VAIKVACTIIRCLLVAVRVGIHYYNMSPLFSARLKRRQLSNKDLDMIRDVTPTLQQGSTQMFRSLRDKGKDWSQIIIQLMIRKILL
jgi:hypothetical protein